MNNKRVRLLDTTLRDGEQMPDVDLTVNQKLELALALDDLGVDSIEAGFPITSYGEFEAVKLIAKNVVNAEVVALARTIKDDIDKAIDADVDAVHVFIATSELHIKHKLKMTYEQVLDKATWAVEYAKAHGVIVEFSAEDATRSSPEFLVKIFQEVVNAKADRIDIADTVGIAYPSYIAWLVSYVRNNVKGNYILSVHCHNDLGMAVANSVTAVEAGADQVHVTMLGVGERAGNAALEEVSTALKFILGFNVNIKFEKIHSIAQLVAKHFNISIPPNKAIVGSNVFTHESGIHVHGILSHPLTYEPIDPNVVGARRAIVLGKHSGKHAVEYILRQRGVDLDENVVMEVLKKVKEFGDKGMKIDDKVLNNIIKDVTKRS